MPSSTHLWEALVVAVLKMVAYLMTPTMLRVDDTSVVVMMVFHGDWLALRYGRRPPPWLFRLRWWLVESGNSSGEREEAS